MDLSKLKDPFPPEDVEWRLAQCGKSGGKIWARCLAYITNRAIMNRLDEVCGPENWRNEYREWAVGGKAGVLCGLSIRVKGEWITKWDGAEQTDIEAVKGGLSDAMKRAAVQWAMGRYLYDLEEGWAVIADDNDKGAYRGQTKDKDQFRWRPPALPDWAVPKVAAPATVRKTTPAKDATRLKAEAYQDFIAALKAAKPHRASAGVPPADKTVLAEAINLREWKIDGFSSHTELQESLGPERFAQLTLAIDIAPADFEKNVRLEETRP